MISCKGNGATCPGVDLGATMKCATIAAVVGSGGWSGRFKVALCCAVGLTLAAPAEAFTSRDGSRVNPVSDAIFEVIPRSGGAGRLYWCGAADYALRAHKAPWQAQLTISRALAASETTNRRSAVQFTLQPALVDGLEARPYGSVNGLARGDTMSVRDAFDLCNQLPVGF